MPKTRFYVTLQDRTTGNRRTLDVRTCKSFSEAETKVTHDGRYHYDPKHEEMIAIHKDDHIVHN
jgi:hypothetical protein